jgi:hypothetical protein
LTRRSVTPSNTSFSIDGWSGKPLVCLHTKIVADTVGREELPVSFVAVTNAFTAVLLIFVVGDDALLLVELTSSFLASLFLGDVGVDDATLIRDGLCPGDLGADDAALFWDCLCTGDFVVDDAALFRDGLCPGDDPVDDTTLSQAGLWKGGAIDKAAFFVANLSTGGIVIDDSAIVNVVGIAAAAAAGGVGIDDAAIINVVGIAAAAVASAPLSVVVVGGGGIASIILSVVELDDLLDLAVATIAISVVVDKDAEEDAAVVLGGGCSAASLRITLTHDSNSSSLSQSSPLRSLSLQPWGDSLIVCHTITIIHNITTNWLWSFCIWLLCQQQMRIRLLI